MLLLSNVFARCGKLGISTVVVSFDSRLRSLHLIGISRPSAIASCHTHWNTFPAAFFKPQREATCVHCLMFQFSNKAVCTVTRLATRSVETRVVWLLKSPSLGTM